MFFCCCFGYADIAPLAYAADLSELAVSDYSVISSFEKFFGCYDIAIGKAAFYANPSVFFSDIFAVFTVAADKVGTASAKLVCRRSYLYLRIFFQEADHFHHIVGKFAAVSVPGEKLQTKGVMRSEPIF